MKNLISMFGLFVSISILLLLLNWFSENKIFITLLSPFFGYFCGRYFTKIGNYFCESFSRKHNI